MNRNRLLIATRNQGKVAEIVALLDGLGYQVESAADWNPLFPSPDETGTTFAGNALLKARYYHSLSGGLTLADDSGLVVDALGGAPGVHSARYAGGGASSAERVARLLRELEGVTAEHRTARFVCAIAIVDSGLERVFEAQCEGLITLEPSGSGGFGFDPIFFDRESGRTFAEMTMEEKAPRSHRGRALAAARLFLSELIASELIDGSR